MVIKLNEKQIWQAIEKIGIDYEDWVAYKEPGDSILHLLIEPKVDYTGKEVEVLTALQEEIVRSGKSSYDESGVPEDWRDELDFNIEVTFLPHGTFANYTALKRAEGADLAHLKPPHVNPSDKVLSTLLGDTENIIVVKKSGVRSGTLKVTEEKNLVA